MKEFFKNLPDSLQTQTSHQRINKQTKSISNRVKIIPLPPGAPSAILQVATKKINTPSGGFVAKAENAKKYLFLALQQENRCSVNGVNQKVNFLKQYRLTKYYDLRYVDLPVSSMTQYSVIGTNKSYTKRFQKPWVWEYCQFMCVLNGDQLLTVSGDRLDYDDMIAILEKYKNW